MDLTNIKAARDGSVALALTAGAASQTIVCDAQDEKVGLLVLNTDAATATATIKAGTGIRKDLGDISGTVAQNAYKVFGPFDSMRFKDMATNKITVELTGPATIANVKIAVIELP